MIQRTDAALMGAFLTGDGHVRTATVDIKITTAETSEIIDITDQVRAIVGEADIDTGIVLVGAPHTTCAVIVNEAEPGFLKDFAAALERLAPADGEYEHDLAPHEEEFEQPNGYAHVRSAILSSPSVMLPIVGSAIALGRWQRIFFVELDRGRPRTCNVTLVGRAG